MNSQTHRRMKKEQAAKRRKYLLQKTISGASIFFWIALAAACLIVGARFAINGFDPPFLSVALIGLFGIYFCSRSIVKTKSLPYVAPVREQIKDLPADEVLLRCSDQPAAAPNELLRAAHAATQTESRKLLRPDDVPSNEKQPLNTYETLPDRELEQIIGDHRL